MADGTAPTRTVFCLHCANEVVFTTADVKERAVDDIEPPQFIDYVLCSRCSEEIPLGLPHFKPEAPA